MRAKFLRLINMQSLFDHHEPGRDHRAVPRHKPVRRQPAANAGGLSRLSGTGGAQHRQRPRADHDALGHAATAAHRRAAGHEHPQHVVPALAGLAEAGKADAWCRFNSFAGCWPNSATRRFKIGHYERNGFGAFGFLRCVSLPDTNPEAASAHPRPPSWGRFFAARRCAN
jgi:hypothetical protein